MSPRATLTILSCLLLMPSCDPSQCGRSGGPFGPCDHGLSTPCIIGYHCLETVDGDMCVPESTDDDVAQQCNAQLGGELKCTNAGLCMLACDGDEECEGGTVCAEVPGVCVWPPQAPAGATTWTSTGA